MLLQRLALFLRSLPLTSDDAILITNFTYAAVKKIVHFVCAQKGARIVYLDITKSLDDSDKLLELIENSLRPNIRYAVFDHIISETATILPIERIIKLLRSKGISPIIDGAHAVGQIPLNMKEIDADFYCSNAHKWLCSGKGCAFLYASKKNRHVLTPMSISHGYPYGFLSEFVWTGTDDYTACISLPVAISFFETIGPQTIMKRNHQLVMEASHMCAKAWGTSILCKDEEKYGSMCTVEIPIKLRPLDASVAFKLRYLLYSKYKIWCPMIFIDNKIYCRISAQIYNSIDDYNHLIKAIQEFCSLESFPW